MIDVDKLDKKYMSDEVITKDDLSGASVEEIVDALKTIGLISCSSEEYGEPGYDNPEKEILFANWNYLDDSVREILEESGYSTEWDDEWIIASDEKAYRTVGNQIGWMPYWFTYESEVYPIKGNEELFVKSITNNPKKAAPEWLDLAKFGFEKIANSESGLYEQCKNISPEEIAIKYADGKDYVFKIEDLELWCTEFSLWVKKEKKDKKMNDKLYILVNYGRSADVTENFTEATIYDNYKEAKKRYEDEVKRIKTMDLINKKEYEYEDEDSYEVSDDWGHVDGVYVKEVEMNKTFPI